jgi:glycosyltransferase involved in cell wall biosynthesis
MGLLDRANNRGRHDQVPDPLEPQIKEAHWPRIPAGDRCFAGAGQQLRDRFHPERAPRDFEASQIHGQPSKLNGFVLLDNVSGRLKIRGQMAPHLSAIIITHNEERRLEACLQSLKGVVDEIVVLDDGSTDKTAQIATSFGARFSYRPFDNFGAQKQAALDLATGEWVLSIDADERVTPEAGAEIVAVTRASGAVDGYWIRRRLIYLGKRLRFGGTGSDWVLRLARRRAATFSPKPVHESMLVRGATLRLRSTLDHIKYESLTEHMATVDRYTEIIAAEKRSAGSRFHMWHLLRIHAELWKRLVFQLGFLDGRSGVIHAGMAAFYGFLKHAKLWRHED